jgi:acyl-CoA thioesterase FadM
LDVRESVVHFGYELRRAEDSALLAEGETTHMVTDAAMKIAEIPDKYMKVFREAAGKMQSSHKKLEARYGKLI